MDALRAAAIAVLVAHAEGRLGDAELDALRATIGPPPPPPPRAAVVPPPPPRLTAAPPRRPACFLCGSSQGPLTPMGPRVWACTGEMCDVPF